MASQMETASMDVTEQVQIADTETSTNSPTIVKTETVTDTIVQIDQAQPADVPTITADETQEEIVIYTDGDFHIIAGRGTKRMLVHSAVLKAASPLFRTIFAKNEQCETAAVGPRVKVLPDDSESFMEHFLAALHHRTDMLHSNYNGQSIFRLGILASKYNCVDAFRPTVLQRWAGISQWPSYKHDALTEIAACREFQSLAAAYIFRMPAQFQIISNNIICSYSGPLGSLSGERAVEYLPATTIWHLNEARSHLRYRLAECFGRLVGTLQYDPKHFYLPDGTGGVASVRRMIHNLSTAFGEPRLDNTIQDLKTFCCGVVLTYDAEKSTVSFNVGFDDIFGGLHSRG